MSYTIIDDINLEPLPQPKKQGMLLPAMRQQQQQEMQPQNPYIRTVHDNFNAGGSNPIINRMMNNNSNNSPFPIQNHSQKVKEIINTPFPKQQQDTLNINRTQYGPQGQPLFQNVPQRNIRTNVTPTISLFVNQQQNDNDKIEKNLRNNLRNTAESEISKKNKRHKQKDEDDDEDDDDKDSKYEMYDKPHKKQKYLKQRQEQQDQEINNDVMFEIQHMSTVFRNHIEKMNDNVLFLQQKIENLATMMKFLFVIIIVLFIMFLRK